MESEDKKPIFTKRTFIIIGVILLIIILILLLKGCGKGKTKSVTGISITPLNLSLKVGETEQFYISITPEDAINKSFTCTSSNSEVLTVDPNNCSVLAVGTGSAVVTVISSDGGLTSTATVIVRDDVTKELTGIKLNASSYSLKVGKTKLVSVEALPSDAELPEIVYSTKNEKIATVSEHGVITAISEGETTLVAKTKDGKFSTNAIIKVIKDEAVITCNDDEKLVDGNCLKIPPKPKTINLLENNVTIKKNETYVIRATVSPADAIGDIVCSANTNVISLTNCVITGLNVGTATIKVCAKDNPNVCADFNVTVKSTSSEGGSSSSTPTPKITINTSGTDGWTTWGKNAWGYIQVTDIKSGYGIKISCANATCGSINNTASSTTFQRGFTADKNNIAANIEVIVTNANGKTLATKSVSFIPTKLDNVAPSCNYYISGKYVIANCTESGSGIVSASSDWTKSGNSYRKYLGTTVGTQTYTLTIKDAASNQYSGSVKVKTTSSVTCQSGYSNYPAYDTTYCLKYVGLTEWGSWTKTSENYVPEIDCVETKVTDYSTTKTTCTTETMGSTLAISRCGDTICSKKTTWSRSRTGVCASGTYLYNRTYCYSRGTRNESYTYTIVN